MFDPHIFFGPIFLAYFQCTLVLVILLVLGKTSLFSTSSSEMNTEIIWQRYHPELYAELFGAQAVLHEMITARLSHAEVFGQRGYRVSDLAIYRAEDMPDNHRTCAWLEQKNSRTPANLIIKEIGWPYGSMNVVNEYTYRLYDGKIAADLHDMNLPQQIEFTDKLIQIVSLIPVALPTGGSTNTAPKTA